MKNLSNFILESLNKNDYKKISDKIIKQFNIYSVNDKGFVDDYVEYVGNNLINSGEWQDIDDDFDKFVEEIINEIKKDGNDSEYDKFSDSNDYTSEEFIKSNKTNFLDIFRSIYSSFKSVAYKIGSILRSSQYCFNQYLYFIFSGYPSTAYYPDGGEIYF